MKKRKPRADPDPGALFRSAVSDATPLPLRNKARLDKPHPKPLAGRHLREEQTLEDRLSDHESANIAYESGEAFNFVRPGVQRQTLRQLRRGGARIEDELDLHGLTAAEARPLLAEFLDRARSRGLRQVRIIHGKGLRSESGVGILKRLVASWLMQREDVMAFCPARPADGGSGAVLVLLRRAGDSSGDQ